MTRNGHSADKLDDKLACEHDDLAAVMKAWPTLPEAVRAGIVAMVTASVRTEDE